MISTNVLKIATFLLSIFIGSLLAFPNVATAQSPGDLIVSPTRIVFEGRTRSSKISLSNRGSERAVFRISFVEMTMTREGQLERIEDEAVAKMTASKMIRYAPRQIEIKPGATQIVRLSLRRPSGLAHGEYRSHLFVRAVPPESSGRSVTVENDDDNAGVKIELIPIFGISIPVIVRHGDLTADSGISDLRILPEGVGGPLRLDMRLTRNGSRSTFGDVTVFYHGSDSAPPLVIGKISKLAVYTTVTDRRVVMPLTIPDGTNFEGGKVRVVYQSLGKQKNIILDSKTISVP